MVEPPADAELARLLDAVIETARNQGRVTGHPSSGVQHRAIDRKDAAHAALLAHIDANYVRRNRIVGVFGVRSDELPEESPDPPIVAGPLSRVPVTIRRVDASANDARTTWPLRAMVGDRQYGSDGFAGSYNVLDCGHESSVLHGGTPERMPDGRYGKRCQRCAAVIDHNERYDYDVRD